MACLNLNPLPKPAQQGKGGGAEVDSSLVLLPCLPFGEGEQGFSSFCIWHSSTLKFFIAQPLH